MKKINKLTIILFMLLNLGSYSIAENNFFEKGKNKYDEQKYEESKFLFQRSIVFNPKDENSYLYLAKIYNFEENKKEEQKNIDTVLLLDPKNEEAIYLLTLLNIKNSNFSKARELIDTLNLVCKKMCSSRSELQSKLDSSLKSE